MNRLSGAFSIEVELGRLFEEIAQRTAVIVVGLLRSGTDTYDRPADPDPGAGRRQGARFGAVTDHGVQHDQP